MQFFSFLNGTYQGGRCPDQKKKDQLSLRRQLDRATQFANEVRSGSIDTSHYDAGPFISERSRHRARNADLCSSSDEELQVQHKNAKKAHRVRSTRSKKFEESLKMAKRAKITLVGTHDMSATKKIFELNDAGKIRLAEISETVSCNCSFARGSDICLHIIWVLMNVLHVNEHDKLLHQKTHSMDSVVKMFRHCEANTVQTQAAAIGTLIETAAPHHNLRPSQAQAASLGTLVGTAAPQHNLRPSQAQAASPGTLAGTASPQHPIRRPDIHVPFPTPTVGQYVLTSLQYCHPNVEKCFGCSGLLKYQQRIPVAPEDLVVVGMMPRQHFVGGVSRMKMSNAYFHANEGCIKCRLPNFSSTLINIQLGHPPLSRADKVYLLSNLNLSV